MAVKEGVKEGVYIMAVKEGVKEGV